MTREGTTPRIEKLVIELDFNTRSHHQQFIVRQAEPKGQPRFPTAYVGSKEDAEKTAAGYAEKARGYAPKVEIVRTKGYETANFEFS